MKTLCVKIGSVMLAVAIPALFVFVIRLDLVSQFEEKVSREDVITMVAKAISEITLSDNAYAKEYTEPDQTVNGEPEGQTDVPSENHTTREIPCCIEEESIEQCTQEKTSAQLPVVYIAGFFMIILITGLVHFKRAPGSLLP